MLRQDLISEVRRGRFHVYAVSTIEEGLRVLTTEEPGSPATDGTYPEGTIYHRVNQKLCRLAEDVRRFGTADTVPSG